MQRACLPRRSDSALDFPHTPLDSFPLLFLALSPLLASPPTHPPWATSMGDPMAVAIMQAERRMAWAVTARVVAAAVVVAPMATVLVEAPAAAAALVQAA